MMRRIERAREKALNDTALADANSGLIAINRFLVALAEGGLCIVEDTEWQKRKRALKDVGL
jgi:hypothetical protein